VPEPGYILVVTPDRGAAPTVLFFAGLQRTRPAALRIAQYRRDALAAALGGASAIVFVRGLFEFKELVSCAERLGIPRYYFLDDHFIVIREQGGEAARFARDHSAENVARFLTGFKGVLVSTAPLEEDFRKRQLHTRLMRFPPTAIPPVVKAPTRQPPRIAFFGGSHLHAALRTSILPAIRKLAAEQPVTLVGVGVTTPIEPAVGLTVESWPYQSSYLQGVAALGGAGVNILAHPVAPGLPGNIFKNPHALITANAIGAVPVVSDAPPYSDLQGQGVAILCADSVDAWYRGFKAAAGATAAETSSRLADYCSTHFDGTVNERVWDDILAASPSPSPATATVRTAAIAATLSAGWLRRGLRRAVGTRA